MPPSPYNSMNPPTRYSPGIPITETNGVVVRVPFEIWLNTFKDPNAPIKTAGHETPAESKYIYFFTTLAELDQVIRIFASQLGSDSIECMLLHTACKFKCDLTETSFKGTPLPPIILFCEKFSAEFLQEILKNSPEWLDDIAFLFQKLPNPTDKQFKPFFHFRLTPRQEYLMDEYTSGLWCSIADTIRPPPPYNSMSPLSRYSPGIPITETNGVVVRVRHLNVIKSSTGIMNSIVSKNPSDALIPTFDTVIDDYKKSPRYKGISLGKYDYFFTTLAELDQVIRTFTSQFGFDSIECMLLHTACKFKCDLTETPFKGILPPIILFCKKLSNGFFLQEILKNSPHLLENIDFLLQNLPTFPRNLTDEQLKDPLYEKQLRPFFHFRLDAQQEELIEAYAKQLWCPAINTINLPGHTFSSSSKTPSDFLTLTFEPPQKDMSSRFLSYSDLRGISRDLTELNFSQSTLIGAILAGVNCTRANFQNADLRGANLSNATVNDADFQGALVDEHTCFNGVRLSELQLYDILSNPKNERVNLEGADLSGLHLKLEEWENTVKRAIIARRRLLARRPLTAGRSVEAPEPLTPPDPDQQRAELMQRPSEKPKTGGSTDSPRREPVAGPADSPAPLSDEETLRLYNQQLITLLRKVTSFRYAHLEGTDLRQLILNPSAFEGAYFGIKRGTLPGTTSATTIDPHQLQSFLGVEAGPRPEDPRPLLLNAPLDLRRTNLRIIDLLYFDQIPFHPFTSFAGAELTIEQLKLFTEGCFRQIPIKGVVLSASIIPSLEGFNFSGKPLLEVSFVKQNLRNATFNGCDMRRANLTGANVAGARFIGADLRDAKIDGARFEEIVEEQSPITANLRQTKVNPEQLMTLMHTHYAVSVSEVDLSGQDFLQSDASMVETFKRAHFVGSLEITDSSKVDIQAWKKEHQDTCDILLINIAPNRWEVHTYNRAVDVPQGNASGRQDPQDPQDPNTIFSQLNSLTVEDVHNRLYGDLDPTFLGGSEQRFIQVIASQLLNWLPVNLTGTKLSQPLLALFCRPGQPYEHISIEGISLSGIDLSGFDFGKKSLRHVVFQNVDLSGADLSQCSNIDFSSFDRSTKLKGTHFNLSQLKELLVCPGLDLSQLNLSGLDLRDLRLDDLLLLKSALFQDSQLTIQQVQALYQKDRRDFKRAHITSPKKRDKTIDVVSDINLSDADFTGATFEDITLEQPVFTGATFKSSRFANVTLNTANLNKTNFREAVFLDSTLSYAQLSEADFSQSFFSREVHFEHITISDDTQFFQCRLVGASLTDDRGNGCPKFSCRQLKEATLGYLQLTAILKELRRDAADPGSWPASKEAIDLSGISLAGFSIPTGISDEQTDWRHVRMHGVNFRGANLTGGAFLLDDSTEIDEKASFERAKIDSRFMGIFCDPRSKSSSANLQGACLQGDFSGFNFQRKSLAGIDLSQTISLQNAQLIGSSIPNARFCALLKELEEVPENTKENQAARTWALERNAAIPRENEAAVQANQAKFLNTKFSTGQLKILCEEGYEKHGIRLDLYLQQIDLSGQDLTTIPINLFVQLNLSQANFDRAILTAQQAWHLLRLGRPSLAGITVLTPYFNAEDRAAVESLYSAQNSPAAKPAPEQKITAGLSGIIFKGSMTGVDLSRAESLAQVNFKEADLRGAIIGDHHPDQSVSLEGEEEITVSHNAARLRNALFSPEQLTYFYSPRDGDVIHGIDVTRDLQLIDLSQVDLTTINLAQSKMNLQYANLSKATLTLSQIRYLYQQGRRNFAQVHVISDPETAGPSSPAEGPADSVKSLAGANFDHAILSGINLSAFDLTGTNFTGADLEGAILRGAILIDSVLIDAKIQNADFREADITGATLISPSSSPPPEGARRLTPTPAEKPGRGSTSPSPSPSPSLSLLFRSPTPSSPAAPAATPPNTGRRTASRRQLVPVPPHDTVPYFRQANCGTAGMKVTRQQVWDLLTVGGIQDFQALDFTDPTFINRDKLPPFPATIDLSSVNLTKIPPEFLFHTDWSQVKLSGAQLTAAQILALHFGTSQIQDFSNIQLSSSDSFHSEASLRIMGLISSSDSQQPKEMSQMPRAASVMPVGPTTPADQREGARSAPPEAGPADDLPPPSSPSNAVVITFRPNIIFRRVQFQHVDLSFCHFSAADFSGAIFEICSLAQSSFVGFTKKTAPSRVQFGDSISYSSEIFQELCEAVSQSSTEWKTILSSLLFTRSSKLLSHKKAIELLLRNQPNSTSAISAILDSFGLSDSPPSTPATPQREKKTQRGSLLSDLKSRIAFFMEWSGMSAEDKDQILSRFPVNISPTPLSTPAASRRGSSADIAPQFPPSTPPPPTPPPPSSGGPGSINASTPTPGR